MFQNIISHNDYLCVDAGGFLCYFDYSQYDYNIVSIKKGDLPWVEDTGEKRILKDILPVWAEKSAPTDTSLPVILALDVTGSMGGALLKTAASLNVIMQKILNEYEDVEFMVMGIGDLSYDRAPIQISQFESDIRIAEHLDRLWFERGGGGNGFESYTAAWYMGLYHTRLDCWEKGRKGILITIGDEPLNPYLPADRLAQITGDQVVRDVNTYALYRAVLEKYEIFHIAIDDKGDCYRYYAKDIQRSFGKLLRDRFIVSTLNSLPATILGCLETVREADAGTAAKPRMSLGKFLLTSNW